MCQVLHHQQKTWYAHDRGDNIKLSAYSDSKEDRVRLPFIAQNDWEQNQNKAFLMNFSAYKQDTSFKTAHDRDMKY